MRATIQQFKLIIVVAFLSVVAMGQGVNECSSRLSEVFPESETVNGKRLFIVSRTHALEPLFDNKCSLIQIHVADKARWNDEEDKSSGLTKNDYLEVRQRLERIYPLGVEVGYDKIGLTSPRGTVSWGQYRNALLQLTSYVAEQDRSTVVVSFTIYFAHEIEGKLTQRSLFDSSGFIKKVKIVVDGESYWTDGSAFSNGELNMPGKFKVFGGPIS